MDRLEKNNNEMISYSLAEASKLTGLSLPYLYKLSASGRLPVSKVGSRTLILRSELEAFLRANIRGTRKQASRRI